MSDENKSSFNVLNEEPKVERSSAPMWIIVVTLALLFVGGVFLDSHGGWFNPKVYPPYGSADKLEAFQPKSGAAAVAAHKQNQTTTRPAPPTKPEKRSSLSS